jgi:zinc/manganese transport system substrate-binding protein
VNLKWGKGEGIGSKGGSKGVFFVVDIANHSHFGDLSMAFERLRRAAHRPSAFLVLGRALLFGLTLLTIACSGAATAPTSTAVASSPTTAPPTTPSVLPTATRLASTATSAPVTPTLAAPARPLHVVAAENFWGSIATQLGGNRVAVTSIITNPDTDPHDYEPTPADARTFATAQYVIVNGIGYDPWAAKLLAANPSDGRVALTVGDLVGVKEGGNPHRWYSPSDVHKVIDQITADYERLDPAGTAYFDAQRTDYVDKSLANYSGLIAAIKAKYAGTPVGASESIFEPLAKELGLDLVTPTGFLNAISEGTDPTASDKSTADAQIAKRQIKVYVYNSQNATPDVQAQLDSAKARGIAITSVTETLSPASATFQDWQVAQLQALQTALAKATGR